MLTFVCIVSCFFFSWRLTKLYYKTYDPPTIHNGGIWFVVFIGGMVLLIISSPLISSFPDLEFQITVLFTMFLGILFSFFYNRKGSKHVTEKAT